MATKDHLSDKCGCAKKNEIQMKESAVGDAYCRKKTTERIESVALTVIKWICLTECQDYTSTANSFDEDEEASATIAETLEYLDGSSQGNERNIFSNLGYRISKLALSVTVLASAHRASITSTIMTRRALYYDLKNNLTSSLVPNQGYIDRSVKRTTKLLDCSAWELGLVASSKGLAFGDLTVFFSNDESLDFNVPAGALISPAVATVVSARSKVNFVLVVEKEAIFRKLLEEKCAQSLNCLIVTGKGYPDIATRTLVKLLEKMLKLPIFVLTDADPYGMEIACVYRFGSTNVSRENDALICESVRWLGVHPSELAALGIKTNQLTQRDLSRLNSIDSRAYMNDALVRQSSIMRHKGKVEIETISSISPNFLTATYLPCKIKSHNYI